MRIRVTLAITLGLLTAACGTAPSVTAPAPFKTQQILPALGVDPFFGGYGLFPFGGADLWYPGFPAYSANLIAATYGFGPFGYGFGGCGYDIGCGYGGWGGGCGYGGGWGGGFGGGCGFGGGGRRGGIAEQNSVAFRPAGSKIWQPK